MNNTMFRSYDLSGVWDFSMAQMAKGTFPTAFSDTISLPNTTSLAKKGTPNPRRETGFLTDAYAFEGQAWFRKKIYIDPELIDPDTGCCPMKLTLERTRMTTLWIDGRRVGSCDSLCTPHVYDITAYVTKPLVEILVLVENTGYPTKGGHLTSPDTQSNWNGITGQMTLEVFPDVYADHVQAYPNPAEKNVTLTMQLHGASTASFTATGSVMEDDEEDSIPLFQAQLTADENGMASVTIPLDEAYYAWSEYHPAMYYLVYNIDEADCGYVSFGMREFCADGSQFTINGQPTMLRGKHDGLIFPKTGYAPTDVNEWLRVLGIAKSYGINHYRFHTCCPPDAAFTAADLLGIYMEPELPFWGTIAAPGEEGYNEAEQNYLIALGDKMLETFGNHPSFVMFSLGNELWGSPERLGEILRHYKEKDSRHLYTQGCNNFQHFPLMVPEDDYFVGVRLSKERLLRGSFGMCDAPLGHVQTDRPSTMHQYDDVIFPRQTAGEDSGDTEEIEIQYGTGVKKVQVSKTAGGLIPTKPVITHEIGQYEVYPDFREIEKYTGPLKARNFEVFRERLAAKGMLHQANRFFRCSGALAALAAGKKTVFFPRETAESIQGFYCTDFWCYPMFRDICNWMKKPVAVGTMGLCIQDDHPALELFPTQEYSTPQWYDIVTAADCTILDDTPAEFTPIVQMIDNFERNHKLGILWEAKVGSGSLLVCTSRLSEIATRPEVRWLAKSLLHYAASEAFVPQQSVTAEQLRKWFGV